MKRIVLISGILVSFCIYNSRAKQDEHIAQTDSVSDMNYFDFDELVHYRINIKNEELYKKADRKDSLKTGLLLEKIPKSLADTGFLKTIENIGYKKKIVPAEKFEAINEIFRVKFHPLTTGTFCGYIFRDILIFRKNSKIVGTAKVCFGCMAHQIHGTELNTEDFGQSDDYTKLDSILNK